MKNEAAERLARPDQPKQSRQAIKAEEIRQARIISEQRNAGLKPSRQVMRATARRAAK